MTLHLGGFFNGYLSNYGGVAWLNNLNVVAIVDSAAAHGNYRCEN